ncbi:MOSC domain-containing protein [Cyclobacterium plantarum]|uniref:MOSC domain-containing protein n=1 Tax=Cyclobacterium plantarum TaxID=2716263 RepID=A0ABX0HBH6_9BACT|nr:MOSC N-terminal beta barrel domain-containing protein [Cyclobacterium plantarum]NHE57791.1 MOSC domain-containing protein [Cyclobacterium plantarum]
MQVTSINIYPIKSLPAISLTESLVEICGLQYDRQWMLVDRQGKFLSQRTHPEMSLFQVKLKKDHLLLSHKLHKNTMFRLPFSVNSGKKKKVTIWEDQIEASLAGQNADEWFSDLLHIDCQLVKMGMNEKRWVKEKYQVNREHVSFADSMPFLIIGQSSLDDLNSRLDKPVPMNRFRPNIVFSGGPAFAEDGWDRFEIGGVTFKNTKPCARCIMTTIDQDSGKKGKEPLYTLSQYRKSGKKILFGQNLIALNSGKIAIGDSIYL